MTAAPQGTLIQIFVELSKWGVGEPPSWSVSRQVARRWLVMGRQRSGLHDPSPKGLWALAVLWVPLAKRKVLGEGGTALWLQLPGIGRWAAACNWWLLGWGSPMRPFANGFEQHGVMGAAACSQALHCPRAVPWGGTGTGT